MYTIVVAERAHIHAPLIHAYTHTTYSVVGRPHATTTNRNNRRATTAAVWFCGTQRTNTARARRTHTPLKMARSNPCMCVSIVSVCVYVFSMHTCVSVVYVCEARRLSGHTHTPTRAQRAHDDRTQHTHTDASKNRSLSLYGGAFLSLPLRSAVRMAIKSVATMFTRTAGVRFCHCALITCDLHSVIGAKIVPTHKNTRTLNP